MCANWLRGCAETAPGLRCLADDIEEFIQDNLPPP
jgi:hypothetical protein